MASRVSGVICHHPQRSCPSNRMALSGKISTVPERMAVKSTDNELMAIVGPTLISTAFSNFLFGPLVGKIFDVTFDDAFYERYIKTISTILLYGVNGLNERARGRKIGNG